jgi:putative transposase
MKYGFIQAHAEEFAVQVMCRVLAVSRSGYYGWLKRSPSAREQADQEALADIRAIHDSSKGRLGQHKLWQRLLDLGKRWGRGRVARLMSAHGLTGKPRRAFRPVTTDSTHGLPVAPNLVAQDFSAAAPNVKWTSDITYLWTAQGWLYLCVVLDLFSRRVVGWALMDTLAQDLVIVALKRAIRQRHPPPGLIFHSDRGSQYASSAVQTLLQLNGIRQSMSAKGNCYDNAVTESWFASFKAEAIPKEGILTKSQAHLLTFDQIDAFYNSVRPHSAIGFLSPMAFETRAASMT